MDIPFERPSWDEYFMIQAELVKLRSNCIINQVGAVIVQSNQQIATGYNGTPPLIKNCFEGGCKKCHTSTIKETILQMKSDRCLCTHAESNAIMHCSLMGIKIGNESTSLYSTFDPCIECVKMAITVGIKKLVCYHTAKINRELLEQTTIKIIKIERIRVHHWIKKLIREYERE